MKFKLIALAAIMAASGAAQATIASSTANGNNFSGDMISTFTSVANAANFTVDLGLRLDQFTSAVAPSATGIKLVWDLDGSTFQDLSTVSTGLAGVMQTLNYGNIFNLFATPAVKTSADLKFDVKAADGLPAVLPGAGLNRYLSSTSSPSAITATNGQVFSMDSGIDGFILAANQDATNSTHGTLLTEAGANKLDAGDALNVDFQASVGDSWKNFVNFSSTGAANTALDFYALANTSSVAANQASVTKYAGQWTFDATENQLIYAAAAPVPEPESIAMLLAGLGMMGAIVRRRKSV